MATSTSRLLLVAGITGTLVLAGCVERLGDNRGVGKPKAANAAAQTPVTGKNEAPLAATKPDWVK